MNLLNKPGQAMELLKMRSQALEMQKKLKTITHTLRKGKYMIKVTGDQRAEYIEIDGESQPELVKAINEALEQVQKDSAKKMIEEGGLSSLLKGF